MKTRSTFIATGCLALAFLGAPCGPAAALECESWHLLPAFSAVQENGFSVTFELGKLAGGKATGSAHYYAGADFGRVDGNFSGTFDGNVLDIVVLWPNKSMGRYRGYVESGGSLRGSTIDTQDPHHTNQEVQWRSAQTFECSAQNARRRGSEPPGSRRSCPEQQAAARRREHPPLRYSHQARRCCRGRVSPPPAGGRGGGNPDRAGRVRG